MVTVAFIFIISYMCMPASCSVTTELHKTVQLTCNQTCHGSRKWTFNDDTVVECHNNDPCQEGEGFEKRVRLSNESVDGKHALDLTISLVEFSDRGSYVGSCDGQHCYHTVEVLVPVNVTSSTGKDVILPCYVNTEKALPTHYVLWKKDDEMVMKYDRGNRTNGSMLENRVSVSEDDLKKGDLSLHLSNVHPSDQGLYHCSYSKTGDTDRFSGAPNSFRLIVQEEAWSWNAFLMIVVILLFFLENAVLLWKYRSKFSCTTGARQPSPEEEEISSISSTDASDQSFEACNKSFLPKNKNIIVK